MTRIDEIMQAERCRRDAHYFIFDSRQLKTKDEQDLTEQVKPVPDFPYLRVLLDLYLVGSRIVAPKDAQFAIAANVSPEFLDFLYQTRILCVEKSRDLFVTNLTVCFIHWRAKYLNYQKIIVQSKNEDDAANLVYNKDVDVARVSFQEYYLPEHLKTANLKKWSFCTGIFDSGSIVHATPEGARVIRSEHPSMVFSDESAFQAEFDASFTAALPAVQKGGFFLAVSSAEPGQFENLVCPHEESTPTGIPGVKYRVAQESTAVVRVHYSAHPERRPGTVAGDDWRRLAAMRYPGGIDSPRWKKEQEIDYGAMSGQKLLPNWEQWQSNGRIVIPSFDASGYRLYASYDHGWRNPASYLVHGVDYDGNICTLWEFYGSTVPVHQIADIIHGKSIVTQDGRRFAGNPYHGREVFTIADPSIWAEDQAMLDNTNKSIADMFRKCGVYFQRGEKGADTAVAEWLIGYFWADPLQPRYRITANCTKLIWELGRQRFKEFSAQVALNKDQPEQLVDKDNHAWDALKMFLKKFPPPNSKPKTQAPSGTFDWWRKQIQRHQRGEPLRTFRIGQ